MRRLGVVLLTAAAVLGPATATAQRGPQRPTWPMRGPARQSKVHDARALLLARLAAARNHLRMTRPGAAHAPAASSNETEPNDTITTANAVSLGDTISGTINPSYDIDVFAIDLTAGTVLDLDVDAQVLGSPLDPVIGLFDTDGTCCLAMNDTWDGLDSRIVYPIETDGRYFVAVIDYNGSGGSSYTYRMASGETAFDEVEPNDTPASANLVAVVDTLTAMLSPPSESDYFAIDVPAHTRLSVVLLPFADLNAITTLYDVDGTTVLAADTLDYARNELDHFIETAGRYYVRVRDPSPPGSGSLAYALRFDSIPKGPGDPLTAVASTQGIAWRIAAGADGALYVYDPYGARLLHVSAAGAVTELAHTLSVSDMVVDGLGDLLAASYSSQTAAGSVWRITPAGVASLFIDDGSHPSDITIGPDGDVWTVGCGQQCWELRHYDPAGQLKSTMAITSLDYVNGMAFSPAGDLHLATPTGVTRLAGSTPQQVITLVNGAQALAFDRDGQLYVLPGYPYTSMLRYDATYQLTEQSFARADAGTQLTGIAFARDATGAMTPRLVVAAFNGNSQTPTAELYQVNPDGVPAPGLRIGIDLLRITGAPADTVLMGAPYSTTLGVANPPGDVIWNVDRGPLPPGLTLDATSGVLSGTPAQEGSFTATIRASSGALMGYAALSVVVVAPGVPVEDAVNGLLGVPDALTQDLQTYLDLQGNHNGAYDIGDLRALLRARGILSAPPTTARKPEGSDGR